jgi:uncharacterized protein YjbI with pentapeptide repeats
MRWFPVLTAAAIAAIAASVWLSGRAVRQQKSSAQEHDFWVLCQPGSAPPEREEAFRRLVAAGNTRWRDADVRSLNLTGVVMPGVDLQYIAFVRTKLARARLDGARLCNSNLELADLSEAQLSQADLREARLMLANLKGAALRGANLSASFFVQVKAEAADFTAADLADANCLMTNFAGAKLTGANLSGAKLERAVLNGADLADARLEGADLTDADLTNANWWRARGLTTQQLTGLKRKFPPAENAPAALKEDYARWSGEVPSR